MKTTLTSSKRSGPSLKARAVSYLSRREHSRAELARKLAPYADSAEEIESLLETLAKEGWQSDDRYVQGVIHSKSTAQGTMRIVQTLKQQGISDDQVAAVRAQLKDTEFERAQAVWAKRFGTKDLDHNATEYARQARFLAARGFSHEIIRQVLRHAAIDEDV